MTEPVAYIQIKDGKAYSVLRKGTPNDEYTPVYTAEQLHPRVKMTQAEFETFKNIKQKNNLLSDALSATAFFGNEKQQSAKQIEFAKLFIDFDLNHPEETIEIVPEMKWFVRSKDKDKRGVVSYSFLMVDEEMQYGWHPFSPKYEATQFNIKEEADLWTNPLTEAVQLPVEEKQKWLD